MMWQDLHTHTTYCDGKNTPREMVLCAIEKGLCRIGFSGHAYTSFDQSYCMSKSGTENYIKEILALKEEYKGKIKILCGIEQDYYSDDTEQTFDYKIGSVHYIKQGDDYIPVDESREILLLATEKYFGGDIYALTEEYFKTVSKVLERTNADIIGHFDLISKFNEGGALFDEESPRYVEAYTKAIDALIPYGKPFEVNTGAISRGYRTLPYPSRKQLEYIAKRGGKVILSGDTHAGENLCFEFEKWQAYCKDIGVTVVDL